MKRFEVFTALFFLLTIILLLDFILLALSKHDFQGNLILIIPANVLTAVSGALFIRWGIISQRRGQ
jgi:hypothetical protein